MPVENDNPRRLNCLSSTGALTRADERAALKLLTVLTGTVLCLSAWSSAGAPATLRGEVFAKGEMRPPIPGAWVSIASARAVSGSVCAACRSVVGRHALTDSSGRFAIPDLPETLLFNLAVSATGYQGWWFDDIGPLKVANDPITWLFEAADSGIGDDVPRFMVHVVDEAGKPLGGVAVRPTHVYDRADRDGIGASSFQAQLTGPDGTTSFPLGSEGTCHVEIDAPGYATTVLEGLPADTSVSVTPTRGASIRGRIDRAGGESAGVRLQFFRLNPSTRPHRPDREGFTGPDGYFDQDLLTAGALYRVIAPMVGNPKAGVAEGTLVRTGAEGSVTEAAALKSGRTYTVAGRLLPPEGGSLPRYRLLFYSRQIPDLNGSGSSGERSYVRVDSLGQFRIEGLPRGTILLGPEVQDFRVADMMPRPLQRLPTDGREGSVSLAVNRDILNLVVPLVPKPLQPPSPHDWHE